VLADDFKKNSPTVGKTLGVFAVERLVAHFEARNATFPAVFLNPYKEVFKKFLIGRFRIPQIKAYNSFNSVFLPERKDVLRM
jgi:hypothetical protein